MTLQDYCDLLGWNAAELARMARIDRRTAGKALEGEEVSPKVAREIAGAISEALGTVVYPGSIEGLNIKG